MSTNSETIIPENRDGSKAEAHVYMTALFNHDIRSLGSNPHRVDTPFGRAECIQDGDLFARLDRLEAINADLLDSLKECELFLRVAGKDSEVLAAAATDARSAIQRAGSEQ